MQYSTEVIEYLNKCSKMIGQMADDAFNQDVFCEYGDLKIESPIEQLFYTSIKALLAFNHFPLHDSPRIDGAGACYGMLIHPQRTIQTYRVDFFIEWFGFIAQHNPVNTKKVVVECDSQAWHERTEKERRYEKRRDRELAKIGLHTFRFTGKEIKEDPFKPAIEVCHFLTDCSLELLTESTIYEVS